VAIGSPYQPSTAPAFSDALNEFLSQDRWKPRARYEITRTLRRYFHWKKPLDKITHQDVAAVVNAITQPSEAAHALKDIKTFFNWCVPQYVQYSPCNGLKPRERYTPRKKLLTETEVASIWKAAEGMGAYGALVQLLFLSGQRVGQFLQFDPLWLKGDRIVWPATAMKGNVEHVIPASDLTKKLTSRLRPMTYQGKRKKELDAIANVYGWVLHDARRFFSSSHARLRNSIDCTEALLAHVSGSRSEIQRVYDLYDRFENMVMAQQNYECYLRQNCGIG
jgi:integrase